MSQEPSTLRPEQLIRISNLEAPIYRIYPLWFFEEALRLKQIVLVAPRLWEDPFEIIGDAIAVDQRRGDRYEQTIINQSLPPAYAQCWSATRESDTLLRAYSRVIKDPHFNRNTCPRDEGVRVRSTPRKILEALSKTSLAHWSGCFVGSVQYLTEQGLHQEIANAVGAIGLDVFEHPANRARLLLMKREAFAHEAEIRLLAIGERGVESKEPLLRIKIDPNSVFEEVSFDPRLAVFERKEREAVVRNLGYTGPIIESQLYRRTLLQIVIDKPV